MPLALVTGAGSGIGRAVALALAAAGHHVVAAGRNTRRLADLVAAITRDGGSAESLHLDLASLRAVAGTSAALGRRQIDVLVNNAGVGVNRRGLTEDGLEVHFGINHLGHFALTLLLLDRIPEGGRVVTVASDAHQWAGALDLDRARRRTRGIGFLDYAHSKLANILFAAELANRQPHLRSFAVHPGLVETAIIPRPIRSLARRRLLSPEQGADTVVWCATEGGSDNGGYYARRAPATPSPAAADPGNANRLWEASLRLADLGPSPAGTGD